MSLPEPLLKQWCLAREACRNLEITDEGIVLGKTVLAPFHNGSLIIDKPRILAMLSVAYGREMSFTIIESFARAEQCWKRGDKALANMHLALTGLHEVDLEIAQRLFACDWGLKRGMTIPMLLKIAGMKKYNPYHLGPGPGGGQFTTAELNGQSNGRIVDSEVTSRSKKDNVEIIVAAADDQQFGLSKDFWRWYHRQVKQPGDPDITRPEVIPIYHEWLRLGKPGPEQG